MPVQNPNPFADAFPIMWGYFMASFVFGFVAVENGVIWWFPVLMSILVYAGSAQFVAMGLIIEGRMIAGGELSLEGGGLVQICLAVLLLNMRYSFMGLYLGPYFASFTLRQRLLYAFGLTDECFAVIVRRVRAAPTRLGYLLSLNTACHSAWISGTLAGSLCALYVSDIFAGLPVDFLLTAMMLFVLVILIEDSIHLVVALAAIFAFLLFQVIGFDTLAVPAGLLFACTLSLWLRTRQ